MTAARQIFFEFLYTLGDLIGDTTEVAAVYGGVHVYHRLRIEMRDRSGAGGSLGTHEVAENLRRSTRHAAAHGNILQGLEGIHAVLRRLHGNVVANAIFGV